MESVAQERGRENLRRMDVVAWACLKILESLEYARWRIKALQALLLKATIASGDTANNFGMVWLQARPHHQAGRGTEIEAERQKRKKKRVTPKTKQKMNGRQKRQTRPNYTESAMCNASQLNCFATSE